MVAARAALGVELVDGLREPVERGVVVELARDEPDALGELAPDLLAERRAGVLADRVVDDLVRSPASAQSRRAKPTSAKPGGSRPAVGQVVHGRHELLAGQVAGDAEDHQAAGPGDARQPPVARVAQRVAPGGDPGPGSLLGHRGAVRAGPRAAEQRRAAGTPAARSVRCSRSTGRPWSASTCGVAGRLRGDRAGRSVNGRSGHPRSSDGRR